MQEVASWNSFEELRVRHAERLAEIQPGSFASLKVKHSRFAVVRAADFAALVRGADLEGLRDDVELLEAIAAVLEGHPATLMGAAVKRLRGTYEAMRFQFEDAGVKP